MAGFGASPKSSLDLGLSYPSMPRPSVLNLASLRSWGLILAPVRLELIEAMRMLAPCSIAQVAALLDRPADSLYRHMDKLVSAGVAVRVGVRQKGRHSEQIYDLLADDISPGWNELSPRQANKLCHQTMGSIAKMIERTARDSARNGELVGSDKTRHLNAFFEHAWLTPEDLIELRALVAAVKSFLTQRKTPGHGRLYCTSVVALPVTRKRGARPQNGAVSESPPKATRKKRASQRAVSRQSTAKPRPKRKKAASAARGKRATR